MRTKKSAKEIRQQLKDRKVSVIVLSVLSGFGADPSYVNKQLREGELTPALCKSLDSLCIKY